MHTDVYCVDGKWLKLTKTNHFNFQIGKVAMKDLIAFLVLKRELLSLMAIGALFQTCNASFMNVF